MSYDPNSADAPSKLHRALDLKDLVLLNIACIVSMTSLAQVAQFGFGSIALYVLAIFVFLIPSGLAVAELNARMPEEGGFYLWTREAFGDLHGYLAAWMYWLSNIVWLPTVTVLAGISLLYVAGSDFLPLADNPVYVGLVSLTLLWLVTLLNVAGMERAKWIQNIGGIGTWLCIGFLVVVGGIFVAQHGSVHEFSMGRLIPDLTDLGILPYFAITAFCFGGLELAPVMAGEVQNPARNIPRAIFLASISVGAIYIVGTLMLIMAVPEGEVGIIEGIPQAFLQIARGLSVPIIGSVGGLLVAVATMGLFGSWMTGVARIPFVIGIDRYLPNAFGKVHPKWGSPYVSVLMQGAAITILVLASIAGSTVKEAFLVLLDMSIILYFIPFLYIFAALVWHLKSKTGGKGVIRSFQSGMSTGWVVAVLGFGMTFLSIIMACIPSQDVENTFLFELKVVGGAVLLSGIGLSMYYAKRNDAARDGGS
ncbi:MAG: APC family permease [Rhodothermales bacterium]